MVGHNLDSPDAYGQEAEPSSLAILVAAYHLACEDQVRNEGGHTNTSADRINQGMHRLITRWWPMLTDEKKNDAC